MIHSESRRLRAVIFDHDGTLVDSEVTHFQIWRQTLAPLGVDFKEDEYIRHHAGMPSRHNASTLIERYALSTDVDTLTGEKERRTQAHFASHANPLLPHAEACLRYCLDSGIGIGLATGASRAVIEGSLGSRSFFPHFGAIATGSDVRANKPAPDVYLLALRQLGVAPEEVLAVEDSAPGIASAKAAGLRCIAVRNPYAKDLSQADYCVDDLHEVRLLIEKLAQQLA